MNETTPSQINAGKTHRARWAAIGAAVAVSLGAGGFGIANAVVTDNPKNVFVAITPCRLIDTRPPTDNVGPRATPIDANETFTILGTGDVAGPCNIPAGISALELNVTAVGATVPTYLTFFPSDVGRPTASNLNPTPGQPPTPNSVTVTLADDGTFNVYNLTGKVDVIMDVVGYYDNHRHTTADISNEPGISFNFEKNPVAISANKEIVSTLIRVPSNGFLVMEATAYYEPTGANIDEAQCQLILGSGNINVNEALTYVGTEVVSNNRQNLSLHRTVAIKVADNPISVLSGQRVRLVCSNIQGTGSITSTQLTATFYSTEYEPFAITAYPFADDSSVDGNADQG